MRSVDIDKVKTALLSMPRFSWEQGMAMQAFMEQGDMDTAVVLAKAGVWRQDKTGRIGKLETEMEVCTDPVCCTEALIAAIKYTDDPELKGGLEKLMNWVLKLAPRNRDGVIYFHRWTREVWSEAAHMIPVALAAAGYYKEALNNLNGYWKILFNPGKKLIHHRWDDDKQTFFRSAFWGVGNGWTLLGLVKTYDLLPLEYAAEKEEIAGKAKTLIDSLLSYLTPNNLIHDFVDDPSTFEEANCPQLLAYSIYSGLMAGWLDSSYLSYAEKIRETVESKVDEYGTVRGVCACPTFDRPGVAPEGQAFFLMLDAVAKKYAGGRYE
jgi:rhamnogalacturonyl hydrolase YesR